MSNSLWSAMIRLLLANMSYRAATIIMKIFLNIFILKVTWDITIVAIFSLFSLGSHMSWYIIFSYILKRGFRNISHTFALWVVMLLLFGLSIYPNIIAEYYILFWIVYGFCSGMYWSVFNNNQFDFTHTKNRGNYEGIKKSLRTSISIGIPVVIGSMIVALPENIWYQFSFFMAAICCFLSIVYGRVDESSLWDKSENFKFRRFFMLSLKHSDVWKFVWINLCISFALSMPLIEVLLPLILYKDWVNEAGIGFFVSAAWAISILSSVLFGRFVQYKNYVKSFTISWMLYIICVIGIVVTQNQIFIYAFMPLVVMLYVSMDIPRSVFTMNVLHSVPKYKKYIWEYLLFMETAIILWRAIVFLLILFLGSLSTASLVYIFGTMWMAIFLSMILFYTLSTDLH